MEDEPHYALAELAADAPFLPARPLAPDRVRHDADVRQRGGLGSRARREDRSSPSTREPPPWSEAQRREDPPPHARGRPAGSPARCPPARAGGAERGDPPLARLRGGGRGAPRRGEVRSLPHAGHRDGGWRPRRHGDRAPPGGETRRGRRTHAGETRQVRRQAVEGVRPESRRIQGRASPSAGSPGFGWACHCDPLRTWATADRCPPAGRAGRRHVRTRAHRPGGVELLVPGSRSRPGTNR